MVILLKVQNPLSRIVAVIIFGLMLSCLYSSFRLFSLSTTLEQIRPTDEDLMLAYLASVQETMLGLSTFTAFLSIICPLFFIYSERMLADQLITWKERPRAALGGILVFQPVMLFMLNSPTGQISRAIALVRYDPQESISLASIVGTFGLWLFPLWALIVTIFVFSYLKIVKAL